MTDLSKFRPDDQLIRSLDKRAGKLGFRVEQVDDQPGPEVSRPRRARQDEPKPLLTRMLNRMNVRPRSAHAARRAVHL